MPVPSAPTAFSVNQPTTGDPSVTIAWSQVGSVSHFELSRRRVGTTEWQRHRLAATSIFGGSSPYSWATVSPPNTQWEVAALNNLGRSTSNPTATFSGGLEGVWLVPHRANVLQASKKVYVEATEAPWDRPLAVNSYEPKGRTSKLTQLSDLYMEEGSVGGHLVTAFSVAADVWRDRFEALLREQRSYRVWFASPHLFLTSVVVSGASLSPWVAIDNAYDIGFSFVAGS